MLQMGCRRRQNTEIVFLLPLRKRWEKYVHKKNRMRFCNFFTWFFNPRTAGDYMGDRFYVTSPEPPQHAFANLTGSRPHDRMRKPHSQPAVFEAPRFKFIILKANKGGPVCRTDPPAATKSLR